MRDGVRKAESGEEMSEELKPCPFCGWYEIVLDDNFMIGNKPVYVCTHCQALSVNWNNRPIEGELENRINDLESQISRIAREI